MLGDGEVCFDGTYDEFITRTDRRIEPYLQQMGVLHDRS
jgi:hypothetical protein